MQAYSNPSRERDSHALPDISIFELTAEEAVELDEDLISEGLQLFPLFTRYTESMTIRPTSRSGPGRPS